MSKQARNVLILLGVAVVAVAFVLSSGGDDGYVVKAELENAGGLRENSSVKIAGVPAGVVDKLEVTDDDIAVATLKLDEGAAPVGRGAKLNVRPTDLLGERYAEIVPGDLAQPAASGTTIGTQDTAVPVELDDVLNMLDADTSARLGIMINELGIMMTGRGSNLNELLGVLPPSLAETEKLFEQIGAENAAIRQGAERADRVASLIGSRREDMGELIAEANDALNVVADRRAELGGTLRSAPGALAQLRGTLGTLDRAAVELRPTATAIQTTAAPLQETLKEIPQFAEQSRPTLAKIEEVSPALTRLAKEATPTVRALEPTAGNVNEALDESSPILSQLARRGFDDLLFGVNNLNLGLRGRDGIGHFIGAKLLVGTEYIDSAVDAFLNIEEPGQKQGEDRTARKKPEPERVEPEQARQAPEPEPVKEAPKDPVRQITDRVKGVTDGVRDEVEKIVPNVGEDVGKLVDGVGKSVGGILDRAGKGLSGERQGSDSGGADALRLFDYLMGQ